jgi:uncharacterized protein
MLSKPHKRYKKILFFVLLFFVLLNIVAINQAYHLTHFYDHGTVKSVAIQTNGFWGKAQVALMGLKLEKLVGTIPDTKYSEIKLKSSDSLTLNAWLIQVPNSKGTVALFHGHGSEKSANLSQSNFFNESGYSTFLIDFRAHGKSEGNTCTIGFKEAEDVKLAYDYLKNSGEKNIILYGISLGAATVTKAIAHYNLTPKKIILEMPFASLPETVKGKVKMTGIFALPIASLLTFWGGCINGFWAFDMKPKEFIKKINCPVLLQWGKKDSGVTETEINEIFKNISASKKLVKYEKSGHENLCENEPDKWEENVDEFLKK